VALGRGHYKSMRERGKEETLEDERKAEKEKGGDSGPDSGGGSFLNIASGERKTR